MTYNKLSESIHEIRQQLGALAATGAPLRHVVRIVREVYAKAAVDQCNGNRCKAARLVHTHRNTLSRAIGRRKYGK